MRNSGTRTLVGPRHGLTLALLVLAVGHLAPGCGSDTGAPATAGVNAAHDGREWFVDQALASGLEFTHVNGMSGERFLAEIMAPGVALLDYDNDGDLDIYVVQGQILGAGKTVAEALSPPPASLWPCDRLYRNDLQVHPDGTRTLRFTDVSAGSGIDVCSYGMGVATADFNNDGWVDLYLTRLGADVLLMNKGDGTFTDVTARAGISNDAWSVSASFLDFDRDGWLDLYVGNYLRYRIESDIDCFGPTGAPGYCTPQAYPPVADRLYRNRGDGTFVDVTAMSGIAGAYGPALGVITADFNNDGWMDVYVANDGTENQLWINQGDGTFRDTALSAGAAVSVDGKSEGSMGVDAGDFDNDGDEDLIITNLTGEGTTTYVNDGSGIFHDRGATSGLRHASRRYTGFGAAWIDFDNDSLLDILAVNGAVQAIQALAQKRDPFPLHQANQVLRNAGHGRFEDVTHEAGAVFQLSEVSRGAAFGDIDNDGDIDVVVANNNGPLRLLINQIGQQKHWLGLRLVGAQAPRDMLGARVEIVRQDGTSLWRRSRTDGSYASANDPRVLVGLGDSAEVRLIRVQWPGGRLEEWTPPGTDRWLTLQEGSGR